MNKKVRFSTTLGDFTAELFEGILLSGGYPYL